MKNIQKQRIKSSNWGRNRNKKKKRSAKIKVIGGCVWGPEIIAKRQEWRYEEMENYNEAICLQYYAKFPNKIIGGNGRINKNKYALNAVM